MYDIIGHSDSQQDLQDSMYRRQQALSPRGEAVHVHVVVPRAVAEGEHPRRVPLNPRLEVVVGRVPHEGADTGVAARPPEDVSGRGTTRGIHATEVNSATKGPP